MINNLTVEELVNYGAELVVKEDWENALSAFQEVAKKEQTFPEVNFMIGQIYFRQGRYQQAEEHLHKELTLQNNHYSSFLLLGHIAYLKTKEKDAINYFQKAINANFGYALEDKVHYNLGLTYFTLGAYQQAAKNWEFLNQYFPENLRLLYCLGFVYAILGDKEKAISYWEKCLPLVGEVFKKKLNTKINNLKEGESLNWLDSDFIKL